MRWVEIIEENASCGGTGAGAVSTVVGGLGAGDPKASIYYSVEQGKKKKKKVEEDDIIIIRRPSPISGK